MPQGWEIAASVVVAGLVILAARGSFEIGFAGGLLGSFLVSNHAYLHDCAILIPGLVMILGEAKASRGLKPAVLLLLTPFPYFLLPMIVPVREGFAAAVLIGLTLLLLAGVAVSACAEGRIQGVSR